MLPDPFQMHHLVARPTREQSTTSWYTSHTFDVGLLTPAAVEVASGDAVVEGSWNAKSARVPPTERDEFLGGNAIRASR